MRSVTGFLVAALLLAGAGRVCWLLSDAQRQAAATHEQLLTMHYEGAVDANPAPGPLSHIPAVGTGIAADGKAARATATYWLARYDNLKTEHDAGGGTAERDPRQLLVGANAAFRASQVETVDRPTALQHLEQVIGGYRDVLRVSPNDVDASYNYEFVIRQRDVLAKQKGAAAISKVSVAELTPTIHGVPGSPPKGVSMSQFRIQIPRRSDERQQNQDAGKGGKKERKG